MLDKESFHTNVIIPEAKKVIEIILQDAYNETSYAQIDLEKNIEKYISTIECDTKNILTEHHRNSLKKEILQVFEPKIKIAEYIMYKIKERYEDAKKADAIIPESYIKKESYNKNSKQVSVPTTNKEQETYITKIVENIVEYLHWQSLTHLILWYTSQQLKRIFLQKYDVVQ
jgi:hypothetical protein